MFKGLKSKLEDEARRLHATVSQYSGNIAQQVRSGVNDVGNDAGNHARRMLNNDAGRDSLLYSPSLFVDDSGNNFDTGQLNEQNPNSSAMMQEIPQQDLLSESQQRHNSSGSFESESSFSNLFTAIPGMLSSGHRLNTITSDVESESVTTSPLFQSASKEQISTVLHKLQGGAANYQDKYRQLTQMYSELLRENEKYRYVLSAMQDKALDRIGKLREKNREITEKMHKMELGRKNERTKESKAEDKVRELQELVEKNRLCMEEKKERIRQLTEENERLIRNTETSYDEQKISDLAVRRITAEWKGRVDCLEEEWSKRLSNSEEASTLAIAKVKAEMHRALEEKDGELQIARARCKALELSGAETQKQVDELKAAVDALENEKADMVEKLSEAKQQGVKAVRCEEEEKRQELRREMERKRVEEREQEERLFQEMIMKNDEQWVLKFKEQEEQMQLAIEEREMQKVAAVMEHDRKNENLGVQVEQLTAEKLHLKSVLDDMEERHRQQVEKLSISIESNKKRHQQEINEKEEVVAALKRDFEAAMKSNKQLQDELEGLKNSKQKTAEGAENRNEELVNEITKRQIIDHLRKQHENEINIMRTEMSVLKENYEKFLKESDSGKELMQRNAEMRELKQELIEFSQKLSNRDKTIEDLYGSLEQKTAAIANLESEKEILSIELASSQELSKIHQHLQQQLKAAQAERDETEKRYSEMEERMQKAAHELEVDRRALQLEKEKLNNHQWIETTVNKSEAEEMNYELPQEDVQKTNDLDEKIALLSDESRQLKNEVRLDNFFFAFWVGIQKLDEEKQALIKAVEHLKKKEESESKKDDMLCRKVNFLERDVEEETDLKSVVDISQNLDLFEDLKLEESCLSFGGKELLSIPSRKVNSAKEEDEVLEELRSKLNLMANEKSSLVASVEALEKNLKEIIEEKNNMMKEMEDIHVNRDNLKIKMEKMEADARETLRRNDSKVEKLKKKLRNQVDETNSLRSAVIIAGNEIKERSLKLDELVTKNEELKAVNEKLRVEFLQKENIVSELQKKIKEQGMKENADLELLKKSLEEGQKRQLILENDLTEAKGNLNKVKIELQERKNNEEFLETELSKERKEKEEEQKIRNQYAVALESAQSNLEEARKQLGDLDLIRIEKDRFVTEFPLAREDCQRVIKHFRQESEQRTGEIKKKAEQKVLEMKCETYEKAEKTELLLQIEKMRSQIAERDFQIEEQKLNISSLEQKLFDRQNEKIMNDLRATIQAISDERDMKLNMCAEMETELNSMGTSVEGTKKQLKLQSQKIASLQGEVRNENAQNMRLRKSNQIAEQLEQERKMLLHKSEHFEKEVEKLQLEIVAMQKTACEESAKASAKVESERHRLLRDLQKEIKQLYHVLNERTQQLSETQSKLQELSAKKTKNDEIGDAETSHRTCAHGERLRTSSDLIEQADYEELCALREQVAEYQKELGNIKEAHKKELTLLCKKTYSTEQFSVIGLESITNGSILRDKEDLNSVVFVESTEAEYLRNVLYRYMNERETLGRESVTLARVIATVARFTHEQVNTVVAKEEQRNHGWVGGTVQGFISSAANLSPH
uniref:GRIP domain-containing protein n=1 Tax=Wuchereria bancrofti TaxID=6293 RepID=A0AAF5PP86_WUCBA